MRPAFAGVRAAGVRWTIVASASRVGGVEVYAAALLRRVTTSKLDSSVPMRTSGVRRVPEFVFARVGRARLVPA